MYTSIDSLYFIFLEERSLYSHTLRVTLLDITLFHKVDCLLGNTFQNCLKVYIYLYRKHIKSCYHVGIFPYETNLCYLCLDKNIFSSHCIKTAVLGFLRGCSSGRFYL